MAVKASVAVNDIGWLTNYQLSYLQGVFWSPWRCCLGRAAIALLLAVNKT